jgi:hypothetical protein
MLSRTAPVVLGNAMATMSTTKRPGAALIALLCAATTTLVAVLASGALAEEKLQKLSAGQIRARIAGMELTDEVHWRELYGRSGTVTSTSMGRKRTGKWRVEKDQLCIEFEKEPPANCYEVWMAGKKVELRRQGLLPLQGVVEQPTGRK